MTHCYKFSGQNIVLDVASGSIHSVDDVTYDVIGMYDSSSDTDKIIEHITALHPDVKDGDIRAILDDLHILREKGKLFTKDTFSVLAKRSNQGKSTDAPTVKALCLNVSHICNMSCQYCFVIANTVNYTGEHLMSLETGMKAIDFLIANSGTRKNLDIDFFGGEPLLNWQVVRGIVSYAREAEKRTGKKFRFTLTTNGLLIDDDVIDFTNKEFRTVVLSLDGRPETHDAQRKLPSGAGSYHEVLPKIKALVEKRRHKGYYIRGTYTRDNMDFVNDILHLAELGFTEISLEPAVMSVSALHGGTPTFTDDDLPELLRQYDILAVEMQRRRVLGGSFRFYHYHLDLKNGPCIHKRIAGCGVATEYLAVTPSGDLYPCHQFIGDSAFLMGDVRYGITNHKLREEFMVCNIYTKNECPNCWARFYCCGGCAANSYNASGSINGVYKVGCELFKKRIENAIAMHIRD